MNNLATLVPQAQLAAAWQTCGDREALDQLIAPLWPRIKRLAARLSREQAEDLAAEGAVALILAIGRWSGQGDLAAYAWPAVRGAMLQARMRARVDVTVSERKLRDGLSGRLGAAQQPEFDALLKRASLEDDQHFECSPASDDLALSRERARHMRRAIARALRPLSRTERRLVVTHLLHEAEELDALAGRLHLTLDRARALEGRALNKMRSNLMMNGFMKSDLA